MLDGGEPAVAEFHRAAQALADIQRASVLPEERTSEFALVLRVSALPSTEAKLIAAQAIPQYVGLFPAMIEDAFNAQLDLCEDDSVQVRIESIRNLPLFCKSKPEFASRISDVLCQLLKQGLTKELVVIRSTFLQTLTDYPVSVKGIFRPLRQDSIEVRRAILAFFKESPDALPRDVELAAQFAASMIEAGGPSDEIIALVSDGLVKTGRFAEMELAQLLNLLKLVADLSRFLRTAQEPVLFLLNETDRISAHSLAFSEPVQVRLRCLVAESLRIKQSLSAQIVETGRASSNPASMDIDSLPPTIRKSMNVAENVQAISTVCLEREKRLQSFGPDGKASKKSEAAPHVVSPRLAQQPHGAPGPSVTSKVVQAGHRVITMIE
nr:Apoptosis inhibitor 5 [Polyrhizophydium stewartii]